MKPANSPDPEDMRPEYDVRGGVRGRFYAEYHAGSNLVLLAPDVAEVFPDSDSVNEALRVLIHAARGQLGGRKAG